MKERGSSYHSNSKAKRVVLTASIKAPPILGYSSKNKVARVKRKSVTAENTRRY